MKIDNLLENITPSSAPNREGGQAPKFGRSDKFLEEKEQVDETTAGATGSGSVATVAQPTGSMQRRGKGSIFSGIKTSEKFPNSKSVKEARDMCNVCGQTPCNCTHINEGAYEDGVNDGMRGQMNRRASSIYGPSTSEYEKGYSVGIQKGKEQQQSQIAQAQQDAAPYEKMSDEELIQLRKDIQQRTQERHNIYRKLRGSDYSFDPKRHTPPNDKELKAQGATDNKAWNIINQVLSQRGININNLKEEGVAEGTEFGSKYAEQLAQQVFNHNSNIDDENEVLNLGYNIAKSELGSRAQGMFRDEDFPSDFVSAYFYLQKQGVAEGSNDTVYPNAEIIKSKNGKPVGEIYQDGNEWGCFHYRADRGYDMIDSREDAIQALKDIHSETGRSRPDYTIKGVAEGQLDELKCWSGYTRVQGVPAGAPGSCKKKTSEDVTEEKCPHCGGPMFSEMIMNEKKDACYYKVKSRYKVWPSAYASGALVKCRKKGADSWGTGGKKNESVEEIEENLRDWFKEKWVRFGPDGKIRGACARGDDSEGKPKCLPQAKAHSLGKKGRASAAARKRREDPNPERSGKAINVNTKKKSNEGVAEGRYPTDDWKQISEIESTTGKVLGLVLQHLNGTYGFYDVRKSNIESGFSSPEEARQAFVELHNARRGVAEGGDVPQWRVEQSDATGRYYVVSGYTNKSRRVWKNKQGAGDFNKRADAEAKAQELNQGLAEVSDKSLIDYLTRLDADSQKHEKDPSKRSPEKRNKSVQGFSRAFNKLDARKEKTDEGLSLHDVAWIGNLIPSFAQRVWTAGTREAKETALLLPILTKWIGTGDLSPKEEQFAKQQLIDVAKIIAGMALASAATAGGAAHASASAVSSTVHHLAQHGAFDLTLDALAVVLSKNFKFDFVKKLVHSLETTAGKRQSQREKIHAQQPEDELDKHVNKEFQRAKMGFGGMSEDAPPGWEKTVKAMKKHKEIDNPWALAWSMKNKGYKSHKKEESMSESELTEEQLLARKLQKELELFKKGMDKEISKKPIDKAVQKKQVDEILGFQIGKRPNVVRGEGPPTMGAQAVKHAPKAEDEEYTRFNKQTGDTEFFVVHRVGSTYYVYKKNAPGKAGLDQLQPTGVEFKSPPESAHHWMTDHGFKWFNQEWWKA